MLNVVRILAAAVILIGPTCLTPAGSAHIVPIDLADGASGRASIAQGTCPLRAWPYIG
jgi:hypothetical protein